MEFMQTATVGAIAAICYFVGMAAKAFPMIKNEWIPVIVGVVGGILGVLGMNAIPDYPAQNIIDAMAVGIMSGLTATGVNQLGKQLTNLVNGASAD